MPPYDDDDHASGAGPTVRRLVIVAGAVATLCIAFLIGYSAHGSDPGSATAPPKTTEPSAPSLAQASPSPDSPRAAIPPGPTTLKREPLTRNAAGVIIGYRHDRHGAIAAAGNYTAALYVQTNRTHARELAVLSSIAATTDDATRMADDLSSEDTALAKLLDVASLQSPGVIAYGHPVGYRVESITSITATIDVYVVGGQGVADAPSDAGASGETFYEVDQVQLTWQPTDANAGDWRLRNWSHLVQGNSPRLETVAAEGYLPFPIGQTSPAAESQPSKSGDGNG